MMKVADAQIFLLLKKQSENKDATMSFHLNDFFLGLNYEERKNILQSHATFINHAFVVGNVNHMISINRSRIPRFSK